MAKTAITKRVVDAAKPATRDHFIWDTDVTGFGLKVTPAGGKVYVYQYRLARPGEAERTSMRRYTIGKHGRLTPEQARKRAKELAAMVEQGIDPRQRDLDEIAAIDDAQRKAAEKARLENDLLFEKVADQWLDYYENIKRRRASSVRMAKSVVKNHLKPSLSGKPIPYVTKDDLRKIINGIPAKQVATRRAVYAYASVLFGYAIEQDHISESPLARLEKPPAPAPRDRVLDDNELATLWRATERMGYPFGPFFRLLILSGQRHDEVAAMKWEELDRAEQMWSIPPERAKNDVAHLVPLSKPVIAELDQIAKGDRWPKTGYVLTTTGRSAISGISKATDRLNEFATNEQQGDPVPGWRIHDFRRTLATGLQRLGVRFEVTEAVINHVSGAKGGVAGIYQRHDWKDEKRAALDAWSKHIENLIQPKEDGKVVPITAKRIAPNAG